MDYASNVPGRSIIAKLCQEDPPRFGYYFMQDTTVDRSYMKHAVSVTNLQNKTIDREPSISKPESSSFPTLAPEFLSRQYDSKFSNYSWPKQTEKMKKVNEFKMRWSRGKPVACPTVPKASPSPAEGAEKALSCMGTANTIECEKKCADQTNKPVDYSRHCKCKCGPHDL